MSSSLDALNKHTFCVKDQTLWRINFGRYTINNLFVFQTLLLNMDAIPIFTNGI